MMITNRAWDRQIAVVIANAEQIAAEKPDAMIGVAVDDQVKHDYFVSAIRARLTGKPWAKGLTFRIVAMTGQRTDVTP